MAESKTRATAIVTCTVHVELTQPWGGEATLEQVQRQARADAEGKLGNAQVELAKHGVRIGRVQAIRIQLNEEIP